MWTILNHTSGSALPGPDLILLHSAIHSSRLRNYVVEVVNTELGSASFSDLLYPQECERVGRALIDPEFSGS
jgi:hypothetical protein